MTTVHCLYCGGSFMGHEVVAGDGSGRRGHRINHPDRPQHGQFHWFTVGCQAVRSDGVACILPEEHGTFSDDSIGMHLGVDYEYRRVRWSSK